MKWVFSLLSGNSLLVHELKRLVLKVLYLLKVFFLRHGMEPVHVKLNFRSLHLNISCLLILQTFQLHFKPFYLVI
jgi:hypothetical protein